MNKRTQKEVLASSRRKRSEKGWVYFSCQVPPTIKHKLQELLNKLRKEYNTK